MFLTIRYSLNKNQCGRNVLYRMVVTGQDTRTTAEEMFLTVAHYLLSMGSCPPPHRNKFGNVVNLVSLNIKIKGRLLLF
jgi:hypothetical protein